MKQENNAPVRIKHRSQVQEVWRRFRKSRSAVLGLSFILLYFKRQVNSDNLPYSLHKNQVIFVLRGR